MKKLLKNKSDLVILIISVITVICGTLAIGFVKSFIIVGIIDFIILCGPNIIAKFKKGKNTKSNEIKTNKKLDKKKKSSKKKRVLKTLLIIILSIFILFFIAFAIIIVIVVKDAPEFDPQNLIKAETTIVYNSNGEIMAKLGAERREKVTYDQLPQVLIDAVVATEDSRFFEHNGFDAARFLKASISQLLGKGGGGASTITMQVSKNAYTSTESSGWEGIKRKFTDIYLSIFKIEKKYTKEEIMEFYVNSYYMGGGAYGVEQASQNYFKKSVSDINLAEAAMLAGMFQSPGSYDPYINPEATEARRKTVLYLMQRHGYITEEEKEAAEKLSVDKIVSEKSTGTNTSKYQDFVDTVIEDVKEKTGQNPYTTPMLIYTTMDKTKQDYINDVMSGKTFTWENSVVQAGVAVIDTNTGAIVAVGAGRGRVGEGTYNYATMIKNQIGSTAKPLYDYGPAIEYNNWSTYTPLVDAKYSYSDGTAINNWDGSYYGTMTMRDALKYSRNIPALKTFQAVDNAKILTFVQNLGLSPEVRNGVVHEAHSIGGYNGESPLTLAAAYAAFGNGGYYTTPYAFSKIVYRETDEEYVYKPETKRAMSEETAYMVADMLKSTSEYLVKTSTVNGVKFGSKSGTSNFTKEVKAKFHLPDNAVNDLWMAGTSRDYAMALWYGYKEINSKYNNKMASGQNTRLYKALLKGIYTGAKDFTKPDGVVKVTLEKNTSKLLLASDSTPDNMKIVELFKKGTEPTEVSTRYLAVDNVSGLTSNIAGSTLTLSWRPIKKSDKLGNASYNVYSKDAKGKLTLLKTTSETSVVINLPNNLSGKLTYVVKAFYSNYKDNLSSGSTHTIDFGTPTPPVEDPVETKPSEEIPDDNTDNKESNENDNSSETTPGSDVTSPTQ